MRIRNFLFFCVHPGPDGGTVRLVRRAGELRGRGEGKKMDFLRPATYNKRRF
ncbi:hypothetical protein HMPREF3033_01573 [Veillonellaceae bacterium DNF00751]|nr:hypothetical protein HMPREF3033_01573 [Veillonellaceae bacterium DNF00751]